MKQLNSGIAPLETRYAGCRFRSRLEARWAVFFDTLALKWEHESQGYKVRWQGDVNAWFSDRANADRAHQAMPYANIYADGKLPPHAKGQPAQRYLPDFYLPDLSMFIEVKPGTPNEVDPDGVKLWQRFAGEIATETGHGRTAMLCGQIPNPALVDRMGPPRPYEWYEQSIIMLGEWHAAWCVCPSGEHFDIQFQARGGRIHCGCRRALDDHYLTGDDDRILKAYAAARSARFEHGETGR